MLRGEEIWSPGELLDKIKQQQLTVLSLPSAYWQQTLQEWVRSPQQLLDLPLRFVMVGGERFLPEVAQLWRRTLLDFGALAQCIWTNGNDHCSNLL